MRKECSNNRFAVLPKHLTRMLTVGAAAVVLSACALSPQYVDVNPTIEVKKQTASPNVVQLQIEDKRPQTQLGTRGGVYKDTSYIYLNKPIAETLTPVAEKALQQLGLQTNGQSPQPYEITIRLDKLTYSINEEKLPKKVALNTSLHLSVNKGDRSHEGEFNSSKEFSYMKAPSEEENEKIINEILSETLTRLFNDPQFITFIDQ